MTEMIRKEQIQHLTPIEENILKVLQAHEGKAVSCETIYETVWQQKPFRCMPVVAVHIRHLRQKLENDPDHPEIILSHRSEGYSFQS